MSINWGFTFSQKYAEELGFDWRLLYNNILKDFSFSVVRICAYWNRIEKALGIYDFSEIDYLLENAKKKNIVVTLAVGRKVPRWPEYHDPDWTNEHDRKDLEDSYFQYLEKFLKKYKSSKLIDRFQIENEPFVSFGQSKHSLSKSFLQKELEHVKSKTNKPVIVTESGEWGNWKKTSKYADILGVNIYPISYNGDKRKYNESVPAKKFEHKKNTVSKRIIITELQAEPWGPEPVALLSRQEWEKSINPKLLKKNSTFVKELGFVEAWMWGVEWWYYIQDSDPEIIKTAQSIINQ